MPLLEWKLNIFTDVYDWSKHPFKSDMDLKGWLAFTGLIIILIVLWTQVIKFIID